MTGQRFLRTICYSDDVIKKLNELAQDVETALDISLVETLLGGGLFRAIAYHGAELSPWGVVSWYVIETEIAVFALATMDDREDILICTDFELRGKIEDMLRSPSGPPN